MDKNRSMVDVAYELMSKKKKAVNFYKLWQEVSEVKGFDEEEKNEKESLLTSNEAKNAKYCIKNDSGMLSVYNATASEKYFDTGVYFEELPNEAKNKVTNGLYFFNETDLYDFLESYSS